MKYLTLAVLLSCCAPVILGAEANQQLPTLAVSITAEKNSQQIAEFDDVLTVELSNQSVLQIVDRQKLQAVLKEHAVALTNVKDTQQAIALGKFVRANYLLNVSIVKKTGAVRLVEVATGQVKVECDVPLGDDLTLSAVAIREKVLAVLRPESQAVNRLTVGITAFPNRSGTERSDNLGVELQKALRKRLQERPWAVVLERQYPTALLEELDLARMGLVRASVVERLPPADLVILGTMEDVGREYEPGKPWDVRLDLTLRLRGRNTSIRETCRNDAIDTAADRIVARIDEISREFPLPIGVSEKELWRRQALYLMPRPMLTGYGNSIIPEFFSTSEANQGEVVRAWQNVLLLEEENAEAMTNLGVCLIGFTRWWYVPENVPPERRAAMIAKWSTASRLLERALEREPTKDRAATYVYCLRPMVDAVPGRAKEMAQFIQRHPKTFEGLPESPWVKVALSRPFAAADDERLAELDRVLANGANDPNAVLIALPERSRKTRPLKGLTDVLRRYENSPDPVVQFAIQRAIGQWLFEMQHDMACLEHYDRAIAVLEPAYAKCRPPHRDSLNNIYRLKVDACLFFNRTEEAKKTGWSGVRHFMDVNRFDSNEHFTPASSWHYVNYIGELCLYAVTDARQAGHEKQELAVCNAFLATTKPAWMLASAWPGMSAKREELTTRLAGKQPPDMSQMTPIANWTDVMTSCESTFIPIAASKEVLWFARGHWSSLYRYDGAQVTEVANPCTFGVAACQNTLYCANAAGLQRFDVDGKLLDSRDYRRDGSLPGSPGKICEGNGRVYFSFKGSPCGGVAVADPATDKITVLAPSSHKATSENEPVSGVSWLSWDAAEQQLFTHDYFHRAGGSPVLTSVYCWSAKNGAWKRLSPGNAPQYVVSHGAETLLVRVVREQTEFRFVKSGQKLLMPVPVPTLLGRPDWDDKHIWAPTASGLYEIDRATGRMTWLAYEQGNVFRSVSKVGEYLYVATSRGLYRCPCSLSVKTCTF